MTTWSQLLMKLSKTALHFIADTQSRALYRHVDADSCSWNYRGVIKSDSEWNTLGPTDLVCEIIPLQGMCIWRV